MLDKIRELINGLSVPTLQETAWLTVVTLATSCVVALLLAGFDFGVESIVNLIM